MKVRLLHPDHDDDLASTIPPELADLVAADLDLESLYAVMASGDSYLHDAARKVLLHSLDDPFVIEYRQDVLADCIANTEVVQDIYRIAVDAGAVQRKVFLGGLLTRNPTSILSRAVRLLELLTDELTQLRQLGLRHGADFSSTGFIQLWAMVSDQLDEDYLTRVRTELAEMELPRGTQFSVQLGWGNKGVRYRLHRAARHNWWERLTGGDHTGLGFTLDERDQAGSDALTEMAGRAVNELANAASQAVDHIQAFFERLRRELAFYLGCLNLHQHLQRHGVPTCLPTPTPRKPRIFHCTELRDIALCLRSSRGVIGNSVDADGKSLLVVTGANEGGKSTFLRSVGSAQLMMQAGMFVAAESLTASVTSGVYTHFKREEDATMTHGKLDEELARMSAIADEVKPDSLLLCNESFASTTEREGSQIGRGVIDALTSAGITVVFVTHLFDLASSLYGQDTRSLFLLAQRWDDTTRTYRIIEGAPAATSFGRDSFQRVFGEPIRSTVDR